MSKFARTVAAVAVAALGAGLSSRPAEACGGSFKVDVKVGGPKVDFKAEYHGSKAEKSRGEAGKGDAGKGGGTDKGGGKGKDPAGGRHGR